MPLLDIFNDNAFGTIALTDAFNVKPNTFGTLQQLGIFPAQGVRQTHVAIERKNYVLNLLPTTVRGGPATKGTVGKRDLRNISIPTIAHEDIVMALDVDGVRAFGSETELETVQALMVEKMDTMSAKHDITLEYLRWGALKGHVLDSDGSTELLDIFTTFGVTQEVQNFALTTGSTEVITKVTALKRYMELNLFGDTMSGVLVFASSGFMDRLVTQATVKTAYQYFQKSQDPLTQDYRNRFVFGGVTFVEENGSATEVDGTVHAFVPANEAIAIPTGTSSFKTYFAPADFIETVNTPGLPRYAKQKRMDYDRGIEIHTQSNPLPMCLRPQLLVRLTSA